MKPPDVLAFDYAAKTYYARYRLVLQAALDPDFEGGIHVRYILLLAQPFFIAQFFFLHCLSLFR
jgi:hypothetical protein